MSSGCSPPHSMIINNINNLRISSCSEDKEDDEDLMGVLDCCLHDDIHKEILIRLPLLKSVFRFKCVSKRWNRLISDPSFSKNRREVIRRRRSRSNTGAPLLGFFQFPPVIAVKSSNPPWLFVAAQQHDKFDDGKEEAEDIINSLESSPFLHGSSMYSICYSNGLFLCGCNQTEPDYITTFYIYDPLSKQSYQLPLSPSQISLPLMGLVVAADHTYKVVCARSFTMFGPPVYNIEIDTFSSETGEWRSFHVGVKRVMYDHVRRLNLWSQKVTVIRGAIHWMKCSSYLMGEAIHWLSSSTPYEYYTGGAILVYDPYSKRDGHIEIIKPPSVGSLSSHILIGESTDGLLQMAMFCDSTLSIQVWVYHSNCCQWSLRHHGLLLHPPLNPLDPPPPPPPFTFYNNPYTLVAFHPHNPDAVFLYYNGHIFLYHLNTSPILMEPFPCRHRPSNKMGLQPYLLPLWPISPFPK